MKDLNPVNSLSAYVTAILEITRQWEAHEYSFRPWCRGQSSSDWRLVPTIYRPEHSAFDEDTLRWDFKIRAGPFLGPTGFTPVDDWDWYFLMQHYGVPTRLLDWTESPLFALYFAVRGAGENATPAVWVMDPWSLNEASGFGSCLLDTGQVDKYLPPSGVKGIPKGPAALQPPLRSMRLVAQKSTFTIHGTANVPIDEIPSLGERLVRIKVGPKLAPVIKDELFRMGVSETSVFPELSSLTKDLLDYWRGLR